MSVHFSRRSIFCLLLTLNAVSCVRDSQADTSIKELVLQDCNAAKEALLKGNASERAELTPYFGQVLQLTLTGMAPQPAQPLPHLPSKIHDNSMAANPANQVDPLRVVDADRERNARRCAVDLLGLVGGGAASALPDLIRYASQHELDDASRDIADDTISSIAERASNTLSPEIIAGLVATLKGERPELSRSVLLILAAHNAEQIAEKVLDDSEIPPRYRIEVLKDVALVDHDAVNQAFAASLESSDAVAQNSALDTLTQVSWPADQVSKQVIPLLFSENTDLQLKAAQRLLAMPTIDCEAVDSVTQDTLLTMIGRDDSVGDAAVALLACHAERGADLSPAVLSELAQGDQPLTRSRAALLIAAVPHPTHEEFELLKKLLVDQEVIVQRAAIRALGDLKIEKRDDVSALLLRYAQKFEKKNTSDAIPQLTDTLAHQIPKFAPLAAHSGWAAVAEEFFNVEAADKNLVLMSSEEQKDASEILAAFGSEAIEIPQRLVKSASEKDRLLGAELLAMYLPPAKDKASLKQCSSALVMLLGDESEAVRTFVIGAIVSNFDRFRGALVTALTSKNFRVRGAATTVFMQFHNKSKMDTAIARTWVMQSGCSEMMNLDVNELLQQTAVRAAVQAKIVSCFANSNLPEDVVSEAIDTLEDDKESTALVVQAALDGKYDVTTVLTLLTHANALGLPDEQIKPLIESVLRKDSDQLAPQIVTIISQLADRAAEFAPRLREFADRADQTPEARCQIYGALSSIAPASVQWTDFFLNEIHAAQEKDLASCSPEIIPEVAQPALEELLKQLPLRSRAAVFSRISALSRVSADEPLTTAIDRALAEPNQELRCQAVRSAIRIGLSSPGIENAVRRGLYNECWPELSTMHGALIAQASATQIATMSRNLLEETRAAELAR